MSNSHRRHLLDQTAEFSRVGVVNSVGDSRGDSFQSVYIAGEVEVGR